MTDSFRIRSGFAALYLLAALAPTGCESDSSSDDPAGGSGGGDTGGVAGNAGTAGGSAGSAGSAGGTAGTAGTAGSAGSAGAADSGGGKATRLTISGGATWHVTFDATAVRAGATSCSYTRHYEGVQDMSRPWVCPSCEAIFRTAVTMQAGLDDCYAQVSPDPPLEEEWVGYGKGIWYRSYGIGAREQGTASVSAGTVVTEHAVLDLPADVVGTGNMEFGIDGSFNLGEELGDPNHGWNEADTYSCGWNNASPPAYTGDYTVEIGSTLPDGLFRDKCDEVFRMHDYKGSYVVVFMSATDCPACKSMAAAEAQFVEEMKAQGIFVATITVMAPSLLDPFGDTSKAHLEYWTDKHGIQTPVVADRGWGLAMFIPLYPGEEELGYPAWIVADPNLTVLRHGTGTDWKSIREAIHNDANKQI